MITINDDIRVAITEALVADFDNKKTTYKSWRKYSASIGIHQSTVSNIRNNKWKGTQLVSDDKWIEVARAIRLDLDTIRANKEAVTNTIQIAETRVYKAMEKQLQAARYNRFQIIICDEAGIGKSTAARAICAKYPYSYLIDDECETGRKTLFIDELARVVGVRTKGSRVKRYKEAVNVINQNAMHYPLLVIDEAGDLDNETFVLLKKLCNQTKGRLGIVVIGSHGLRKKIERGLHNDRNGFAEFYSRFGERELTYVPHHPSQKAKFYREMTTAICTKNGIETGAALNKIIDLVAPQGGKTVVGDMRRVEREILKYKYKKQLS